MQGNLFHVNEFLRIMSALHPKEQRELTLFLIRRYWHTRQTRIGKPTPYKHTACALRHPSCLSKKCQFFV
ncbi:hypothetical protein GAO43_24860 [Bacteroides thetaiotaomicron]|nr:hypothetical protein GAO47_17670 [Bacteroides thetaiotaomicron]KAB4319895.1 hypothetical protein GAO43_24860 [Bacteroides thetaiotaomicron]KAB4335560.1 hypothetical protein GAO49_24570 [Bacteroides thetaiotaomicron]KAB4337399.1 hypothetical protein GAO37_23900 [Bacteroides thetaiotaomicron]KAB4373691.1 hypothetical protein GAO41_23300 [Bacteroides thetaiotaomicron]